MPGKNKRDDSPMITAVHALQDCLNELERVGNKINSTDLAGEIDVEHIQKLLNHFAECGQGISDEVTNLSRHLQEAQARAQAVAQGVSRQAEIFHNRRNEQNEKLEQFRLLGDRVREINAAISIFKRPAGEALTSEDRSTLESSVPVLQGQLSQLIADLHELRQSAKSSRMRTLERNAESLMQSLQAVQVKLRDLFR
jgi:chromosome segregation ATPase